MRIAMWSGPRNLSTAMMYSFGARTGFSVVDEPYYAAYLAKTGADHPLKAEILASQNTDSDEVSKRLSEPNKEKMPHIYEKHMTHHMLPGFDLDWMAEVRNIFLIRHPARVIVSYLAKREQPTFDDLGFRRQAELFDHVFLQGQQPLIIDSVDIRRNPGITLTALCHAIGLPFQEQMLSWSAGGHPSDGVWAKHWYGAVHRSTGFAEAEGPLPEVPSQYQALLDDALPYYLELQEKSTLRFSD